MESDFESAVWKKLQVREFSGWMFGSGVALFFLFSDAFFLPTIILVKEASTTSLNCSCISSSPNGYISEGNISTLSIDFYWISSILEDDENE